MSLGKNCGVESAQYGTRRSSGYGFTPGSVMSLMSWPEATGKR